MSTADKEKIFVQLRSYHANEFAARLATDNMDRLRVEFAEIEDKIVAMILNLVNGKLEFADLSGELHSFQKKVKITPSDDRNEDSDRAFFISKIDQLIEILELAKAAPFKLKMSRFARVP